MERRGFLKLLGLAPAAMLSALPLPALPEPEPDEVLHYPATTISDMQRRECVRWLDSIGYGYKRCFDIEIWIRHGRSYRAVLHCFAQDSRGEPFIEPGTHAAAVEPPTVLDVTSQPERLP